MAVDVFHHHHRIIDHQADGDGQTSQRHQIERAAKQADKKECRYHGQRQARRRHQGDSPIAQESKQNHHRQNPADQDSVADTRHGLPYEFRQVVHRGNVQRGWNQIFAAISDLLHLLGNLVDVATDLACHVDQRRRPAVAGDQCSAVGGAFADQRNVAQSHRAGSLGADHRVADIVQVLELRIRQRQILLIVFIQPPHAGYLVARPQPLCDFRQADPLRHRLLRIHNHRNLPRVRGIDVHQAYSRNPAECRTQVVHGVVVQVHIGHVSVQHQTQNRPHRGRKPFNLDDRLRRNVRARLVHPRLHQLQRLLHVGVVAEIYGYLGAAAYGPRPHPPKTSHRAHLLLNRTGDGEQHGLRRKIAGVRQHYDSGKTQLGINVAGQLKKRNQPGNEQRSGQQKDCAAVLPAKANQVH